MKKLLVLFTLLLSISSFAELLTCSTKPRISDDYGAGIYDVLELNCEGKSSKQDFKVEISGFGLALRFDQLKKSTLVCPFREGIDVEGTYYGIKAEAAVLVGLNTGIFYNKTQSCILTGASLGGLGASLVGATMVIELD